MDHRISRFGIFTCYRDRQCCLSFPFTKTYETGRLASELRFAFSRSNVVVYLNRTAFQERKSIHTAGTKAYRSSRLWSEQAKWQVKRYVTARLVPTKRSSPGCLVTQCQGNYPGTCGPLTGLTTGSPSTMNYNKTGPRISKTPERTSRVMRARQRVMRTSTTLNASNLLLFMAPQNLSLTQL
jgi:hypothetical protein